MGVGGEGDGRWGMGDVEIYPDVDLERRVYTSCAEVVVGCAGHGT